MADMKEVIERLAERTDEQRVPWKATNDDGIFAATIGDMSVMVSSERLSRRPGEPPYTLKITVLDEKWDEISSFEASMASASEYQRLYSLWQAAKASATGAHPRLDEFLEALDAAPPVANQKSPAKASGLNPAQPRRGRRLFSPR